MDFVDRELTGSSATKFRIEVPVCIKPSRGVTVQATRRFFPHVAATTTVSKDVLPSAYLRERGRVPHVCLCALRTRRVHLPAKAPVQSRSACVHRENFARSRWPSGKARLPRNCRSQYAGFPDVRLCACQRRLGAARGSFLPAGLERGRTMVTFLCCTREQGGVLDRTHSFSTYT